MTITASGLLFGQYTSLPDGSADAGTSAGNWLKLSTGVRSNGMGGSGLLAGGAAHLPYNPAGLALIEKSQVYFSSSNYLAGTKFNVVAYATAITPRDYVGFHLFTFNSGDINVTIPEYSLGTGEQYEVKYFTFRTAYARKLTGKINLGFTVNYVREQIYTMSYQTLAFDLGAVYNTGILGNVIGINLSNIAPEIQFGGEGLQIAVDDELSPDERLSRQTEKFTLPFIMRFGIQNQLGGPQGTFMKMQNHRIIVAADAIQAPDYSLVGNVGLEYGFYNLAFVRLGSYLGHDTAQLTFGGGLNVRLGGLGLTLDYAMVDFSILKPTHHFSIGAIF